MHLLRNGQRAQRNLCLNYLFRNIFDISHLLRKSASYSRSINAKLFCQAGRLFTVDKPALDFCPLLIGEL